MIEIPKLGDELDISEQGPSVAGKPGWIQPEDLKGLRVKPLIRCNCGWYCGIGLHHVHSDGTVTASFFHTKTGPQADPEHGCEWHVFLKLKDYDGGDFPPRK